MMKVIHWIAAILVVIGALNWGLIGIFDFNLVAAIFEAAPVITRIIYILVGISGLWMIYAGLKCCCSCKKNVE